MPKFSREEVEQLARSVTEKTADDAEGFFPRLGQQLDTASVPTVTVEWQGLNVVAEGKTSAESLPSVPNVFLNFAKALTCQRAQRETLNILRDLSGRLEPTRLTLLLGPPSCGKTTLLRALAGRLPRSDYTGSITYNGHAFKHFCAPRTAAFVPQSDAHIPNYTALEATSFAYDLQHGPDDSGFQASEHLRGSADTAATHETGTDLNHEGLDAAAHGGSAGTTTQNPTSSAARVDTLQPGAPVDQLADSALAEMARDLLDGPARVHTVMELFSLGRAKDTMAAGCSGGERKRLSTVEMLQGRQQVLFMDEISTGLDAATLYTIMTWLRAMAHTLRQTVLISLLQPPPETYALFDDVMLMAEGTVLYHGPVADAVDHMCSFGFELPPRKDVPSFLQEVTTVRGQLLYGTSQLRAQAGIAEGFDATDEVAVAQLERLVSLDSMRQRQRQGAASASASSLAQGSSTNGAHSGSKRAAVPVHGNSGQALIPRCERYAWGRLLMLRKVLARQAVLFKRDPTLTRARLLQSAAIGLLVGGLWFQLAVSFQNARTMLSVFFFFVLFITLSGTPQLAVMLRNRATFFKQRDAGMYTATAYAWSAALVQVPLAVLESFVFLITTYFMIGLATGAGYFFICWLILVTASLALTACFRSLACFILAPATAQAASGFLLLLVIVGSGIIITRSSIPPWAIWMYWLSPFSWSVRALAVNEMTSPRWQGVTVAESGATGGAGGAGAGSQSLGDSALAEYDIYVERYWIWAGIAYNVLAFAVITQASATALHFLTPAKRVPVIQSKEQALKNLEAAIKARQDAQDKLQSPDDPAAGTANSHGSRDGDAWQRSHKSASVSGSGLNVASQLAFTPISLVWQELSYYVPAPSAASGAAATGIVQKGDTQDDELAGKKQLLNSITGYAQSGVLTALMGATGAGKTTLMDVLAGRKAHGTIRGSILVNGHPKEQATWARVVGYVEQVDVHSAGLTVEESLRFSAALRLTADVGAQTRAAFVLEVLVVTELLDIRGNVVGAPGVSGLSVEQRRRLSIAVELVANPSVVFMDEPTSGLDARSAATVMQAVRNVAANGRTVMVTIHQPSIEIFESFHRLVLLAAGGHALYIGNLGKQSRHLIRFLQDIDGVDDIPEGYNPATWMLEVTGAGYKSKRSSPAERPDFPQIYRESKLGQETSEIAAEIVKNAAADSEPLNLASRYAATRWQQVGQVTKKLFLVYWRTPGYSVGRTLMPVLSALAYGAVWFDEGTISGTATISDISNILGSIYSALAQLGIANLIAGIPIFYAEREVMYKERAASMYAVLPYALATGLVEVPYLLMQSALFSPIFYFMVGFEAAAEPFFLFVIIFAQSLTLYTFLGQLLVYLVPTQPLAALLGSLSHTVWTIFNGYLVPRPLMAPGWWWLNYLCGTTWVIYGVAASQLGAIKAKFVPPGGGDYPGCADDALSACPTLSQWLEDYFGYKYAFRWWCVLILIGFIATFRVAAMIALKVVNHDSR